MPIYEYQCEKCKRVLSFLVRNVESHKPPTCPKYGHKKMTRAISRFAALKGRILSSAGGDDMPDLSGFDENDPRAMGRMMRQMADKTGEAMPPEMDEMCRRLEAGEDPEKIEEEMGDVLGKAGPGGGMGSDNTLYEG